MPTLPVAIDASGATRGAAEFQQAARKVSGQARDVEGRFIAANKSVSRFGGSLRTILPMLSVAGALYATTRLVRSIVSAAAEQERTLAQLRTGLISTGGVSGQTMESMRALSAEMQATTVYSNELVESSMAVALSFTNIADDVFPRAIKVTADIATRMGTDLQSSLIQVAKALNDPVANLGALSRAGIQFSVAQKKLIKDLWETGKQAEAQRVILAELEAQYGGSATAARETMGGALKAMGNAFGDVLKGVAPTKALTAVFGVLADNLELVAMILPQASAAEVEMTAATERATEAARARNAEEKKRLILLGKSRVLLDREIKVMEDKILLEKEGEALFAFNRARRMGATEEQLKRISDLQFELQMSKDMAEAKKREAIVTETTTKDKRRLAEEHADLLQMLRDEGDAQEQASKDKSIAVLRERFRAREKFARDDAALIAMLEARSSEAFEVMRRNANESQALWEETGRGIAESIGGAVKSIIFDFDSAGETAVQMLKQIASELLQYFVIRKMVEGIGGYLGGLGGTTAANGLVFNQGAVVPMARGGIVDRPTQFPMSGGRSGLMGESGPEGVLPLARDKSGKLGVSAEGVGGVVQNNTFHITTPDADSFRRSKGQILADIRSGASRLKG